MALVVRILRNRDLRVESCIQNYTGYWQKDLASDSKADRAKRLENYTEVANGFYDGATRMYEYGWGRSMHVARLIKGEYYSQSVARHEHYLAAQMGLKPGMCVLDVGCGLGGPARELAFFAGVQIVCLNNNDLQLARARAYTAQQGLQDKISYVKGDFMKLVELFGENRFDAVYAIEATTYAPTFEGVYDQIRKVLRPGGVFGAYEMCMTDAWDDSIQSHRDLAHRIEFGIGVPQIRTVFGALSALRNVGFELLHQEDLAERPDSIPWYTSLQCGVRKTPRVWDIIVRWPASKLGRRISQKFLWPLDKAGVVPRGTYQLGKAMVIGADAMLEGGRKKLFTPMLLLVGRKPTA